MSPFQTYICSYPHQFTTYPLINVPIDYIYHHQLLSPLIADYQITIVGAMHHSRIGGLWHSFTRLVALCQSPSNYDW